MIARLWLVLGLIGLCSLIVTAAPFTVLYTNDLHVRLDRLDGLAKSIKQQVDAGDPVLLFDAGDTWQDHRQWISNAWGDEMMVAWMNAMGYGAMAVGNHDLYWGPQRLAQLVEQATFPVLAANWLPVREGACLVQAASLVRIGELRLLVIGLITPEFLPVPAYPGWRYRDPVLSVREQVENYCGLFDGLIVLGHMGLQDARSIAQAVPQIDLFISGHSHQATSQPILEGRTLIVQSGAFGQRLGRLSVDMADGTMVLLDHELIPIERTPVDVRAGVRHLTLVLAVIASAIAVWAL